MKAKKRDSGKSIREKLESKGWILDRVVPNECLAEGLAIWAVDLAKRRKYSDTRIIPAEIGLAGEDWQPKEPSHMFYGKPTRKYLNENKKERSVRAVNILCVDGEGHEQFIPLYCGGI